MPDTVPLINRPTEEELRKILPPTDVLPIKCRVILDLTDPEYILLLSISSRKINAKDTIRTETIQSKIPPLWKQHIGVEGVCRDLVSKGILRSYRSHNWEVLTLGHKILDLLRQLKARRQGLSRLLIHG